jgi:hypothetical protein
MFVKITAKWIWVLSPGAPYRPVLRLNEPVPHLGAAAAVVFTAAGVTSADATATLAAQIENL